MKTDVLLIALLNFTYSCRVTANILTSFLEGLENTIYENKNKDKTENDYAKFYNYIYQGTAGRQGRTFRGELISKELKNASI